MSLKFFWGFFQATKVGIHYIVMMKWTSRKCAGLVTVAKCDPTQVSLLLLNKCRWIKRNSFMHLMPYESKHRKSELIFRQLWKLGLCANADGFSCNVCLSSSETSPVVWHMIFSGWIETVKECVHNFVIVCDIFCTPQDKVLKRDYKLYCYGSEFERKKK